MTCAKRNVKMNQVNHKYTVPCKTILIFSIMLQPNINVLIGILCGKNEKVLLNYKIEEIVSKNLNNVVCICI